MENLKKLEEITLPDRRNTCFVLINQKTGRQRKFRLEDLYEAVKSMELHQGVPEDVRSQFNVARNVALYSWFCYPFHNVANMKTYATLEMALRIKFGQEDTKKGLYKLVETAVKQGLIKDKHFSHIKGKLKDLESTCYVERLPEITSFLRNTGAHGSTMLYNGSILNLHICADFINQIFRKEKDVV
jgi:hypothetical protein